MAFDWFKRLFALNTQTNKQTNTQTNEQAQPIEIDKDSLQLGLAGGVTGRFIRDIDSTLNRIETLMPSKDWLTIQLQEQFTQHEENEQRRFETIVNALGTLHSISVEAPEPVRTQLLDTIRTVEAKLGLSKRMQELIQLVRYSGEASYHDLAQKMGLTESGFRSLLAMTLTRTNEIEKFERDNRTWLRYRQSNASNTQSSASSEDNQTNTQTNE